MRDFGIVDAGWVGDKVSKAAKPRATDDADQWLFLKLHQQVCMCIRVCVCVCVCVSVCVCEAKQHPVKWLASPSVRTDEQQQASSTPRHKPWKQCMRQPVPASQTRQALRQQPRERERERTCHVLVDRNIDASVCRPHTHTKHTKHKLTCLGLLGGCFSAHRSLLRGVWQWNRVQFAQWKVATPLWIIC